MKTFIKTFGAAALFSLFAFTAQAEETICSTPDCLTTDTVEAKSAALNGENGEFDYDFENPFHFADKVVVTVLNASHEEIYHEILDKDAFKTDCALHGILKESDYVLNVGNEYFYLKRD